MRRLVLRLVALVFMMSMLGSGLNLMAQDNDRKKDSLSIDDMDPVIYAAEEEATKGGSGVFIAAAIIVVVAGGGTYVFLSRKKKKRAEA